jgi:pimeloyl-ACP methyl ester carboxylesterase
MTVNSISPPHRRPNRQPSPAFACTIGSAAIRPGQLVAWVPVDRLCLARRGPALAKVGLAVLIPDMRGYGDSDKAAGNDGYDARSLAEEGRALVAAIGFGKGKPLIHAAHDMGALLALIWTADHPDEVAGLLYIEAPVMLGPVLRQVFSYTPQAMAQGQ